VFLGKELVFFGESVFFFFHSSDVFLQRGCSWAGNMFLSGCGWAGLVFLFPWRGGGWFFFFLFFFLLCCDRWLGEYGGVSCFFFQTFSSLGVYVPSVFDLSEQQEVTAINPSLLGGPLSFFLRDRRVSFLISVW